MDENWCALYLAIVKDDISVDKALATVFGRALRPSNYGRRKPKIKNHGEFVYIDDPVKLIELKKKHTYREIADMYGTYADRIYLNIKHYKQASGMV